MRNSFVCYQNWIKYNRITVCKYLFASIQNCASAHIHSRMLTSTCAPGCTLMHASSMECIVRNISYNKSCDYTFVKSLRFCFIPNIYERKKNKNNGYAESITCSESCFLSKFHFKMKIEVLTQIMHFSSKLGSVTVALRIVSRFSSFSFIFALTRSQHFRCRRFFHSLSMFLHHLYSQQCHLYTHFYEVELDLAQMIIFHVSIYTNDLFETVIL